MIRAVRGVSFAVACGGVLGIVGESGCGKSVSCHSILRLLPGNARVSGRIEFDGRDLTRLTAAELDAIRGREIAMIFQDPAASLNPVHTIGSQIAESLILHRGTGTHPRPCRGGAAARPRRHPRGQAPPERISASALRRHEPARDDRDGARLPSQTADRRRTDHRTGCHHPGTDPRSAAGTASRSSTWR